MADYSKDVLVDTQWVQDHLDDDGVRIVEVDENPALYAEAHIPGAIGFDWRKDLQDQVKRDFLGPEEFGALFGSRGISNEHTIVLYGDRNNWFAAYTYWYLKYYGHDDVKLVNGPREKWIAEDRPTTTDAPGYEPTTFTAQHGDDAIRAKRDEVLSALDSATKLVDVRSPQEFSGELIAMPGYEQEGAQRAGHIPGAASVPWAQAVREDGTFKSADELSELYGAKGVTNGEPIIAYCRIGERSAHTWFVLHELLGKDDVKNYDGSWTEWGNMVNVPIEKSASQQVSEDAGGRSPDEVAARLVRRGAEGDAPPHQPALTVAGAQLLQRQLEHLVDLGLLHHPGEPCLDHADERIDRVVGDEGRRRRQGADHAHRVGRQADLLVRLAQRRVEQLLAVVAPAAGERDLARVAAQVVPAAREDGVQPAVALEHGNQHGGVAAAVHVHGQRLLGRDQDRGQLVGDAQASSTRSSNMTSPSSVRWTGHLAAITRSLSICSSSRCGGILSTSSNLVGQPRSAGVYSTSTVRPLVSQPLRWAYISIVTAVHEASAAASSSCGLGPSS